MNKVDKMLEDGPPDSEEDNPSSSQSPSTTVNTLQISLAAHKETSLASEIQSNPTKLSLAWNVVDPSNHTVQIVVDDLICDRADLLVSKLRGRFKQQTPYRIKLKRLRAHWSMQLANKIFPTITSLMILSRHITKDLSPLAGKNCLLLSSPNDCVTCANLVDYKGVMLLFDSNKNAWIGSGVATKVQ